MTIDSPTDGAPVWLEGADGIKTPLHGNCSLGRSNANSVVIREESASRQHATIHAQDEGEYWLIDLGSSNGTFLNDLRVSRPTRLHNSDRIRIAGVTWTFRQRETGTDLGDDSMEVTMLASASIHQAPFWMLLADIEGFTPLSRQLDAKALSELVGSWVKEGRSVVEKHGGSLNKYLGDGFLAVWQANASAPDSLASTLQDFRAMQEKRAPAFRVVLHYGEVIIGGGAAHPGEENLAGLQVNFTFRLEKLAGGLKVPRGASEAAITSLNGRIPFEPVDGDHALKGIEGTHRLYSLLP